MPRGPEDWTDPGIINAQAVFAELRSQRRDSHGMLSAMGERLVRVETKIDDLSPHVAEACSGAEKAQQDVANVKGQWKILAWVIGSSVLGGLVWAIRGLLAWAT